VFENDVDGHNIQKMYSSCAFVDAVRITYLSFGFLGDCVCVRVCFALLWVFLKLYFCITKQGEFILLFFYKHINKHT
jgi:hypothetical protein